MKDLQPVSFNIKKKHPAARRNVLFEDATMDLVLDFCVNEGAPWRRITSRQARTRQRKSGGPSSRAVDNAELDKLLGQDAGTDDDELFDTADGSPSL